MEVQRRTAETIDAVDRLLSRYGSLSPAPRLLMPQPAVPHAPPLNFSVSAASQTELRVCLQKSTQISPTSRAIGTETHHVVAKSVAVQTDKDDFIDNLLNAVSQAVGKAQEQCKNQQLSIFSRLDAADQQLMRISSRAHQCSQRLVFQRHQLERLHRSEFIATEMASRQAIETEQADSRCSLDAQFFKLLLQVNSRLVLTSNNTGCEATPVSQSSAVPNEQPHSRLAPDPLALLLDECTRALEDDV